MIWLVVLYLGKCKTSEPHVCSKVLTSSMMKFKNSFSEKIICDINLF